MVAGQNKRVLIITSILAITGLLAWQYQNGKYAVGNDSPNRNLESTAKESIRNLLKDKDSAQFRSVTAIVYGTSKSVCGEVNGKNGFGGFTGFQKFLVTFKPDGAQPDVSLLDDGSERFQKQSGMFCH